MTSADLFNRRTMGRPVGKFQTLHIEGGGHGFVLVDLDTPIPRPDPVWLKGQLAQREVTCEYPGCTELAVTYVELPKVHTPFLCKGHELACTHDISAFRVKTRRVLMDAMLDEIFLTGYGTKRRRHDESTLAAQMDLPLAPSGHPGVQTAPTTPPVPLWTGGMPTFNRPKLGQN